jgi:hypothetical protein
MPRVGFEPTIPVFERAKMVYALDRATTVIGSKRVCKVIITTTKIHLRFINIVGYNIPPMDSAAVNQRRTNRNLRRTLYAFIRWNLAF